MCNKRKIKKNNKKRGNEEVLPNLIKVRKSYKFKYTYRKIM
jgi:hypothetical protein